MPTAIRDIEGFPYCPPDSFSGQGITLAGINEVISSIKNTHSIGRVMCKAAPIQSKKFGAYEVLPVCGLTNGAVLSSTGISSFHCGEILPGYNRIMVRAELYLPSLSGIVADQGGNIIQLQTADSLNVWFQITNEVTGITATIARFFINEANYSNLLATMGAAPHGTPVDYIINVGNAFGIYTFIADIPITILPTAANYADYCSVKCTLGTAISQTPNYFGYGFVGCRGYSISQLKTCS